MSQKCPNDVPVAVDAAPSGLPWWQTWSYFVGPCVHGRDPYDRCDICGRDARLARALSEMADQLRADGEGDVVIEILLRCGIPDDEEHEEPPPGTDILTTGAQDP